MKKLSMSFAILAIVFALSSAFTSQPLANEWFLLETSLSEEDFQERSQDIEIYDVDAVPEPGSGICDEIQELVCAVQFNDANNNEVLDNDEEDAQPLAIKYRSE